MTVHFLALNLVQIFSFTALLPSELLTWLTIFCRLNVSLQQRRRVRAPNPTQMRTHSGMLVWIGRSQELPIATLKPLRVFLSRVPRIPTRAGRLTPMSLWKRIGKQFGRRENNKPRSSWREQRWFSGPSLIPKRPVAQQASAARPLPQISLEQSFYDHPDKAPDSKVPWPIHPLREVSNIPGAGGISWDPDPSPIALGLVANYWASSDFMVVADFKLAPPSAGGEPRRALVATCSWPLILWAISLHFWLHMLDCCSVGSLYSSPFGFGLLPQIQHEIWSFEQLLVFQQTWAIKGVAKNRTLDTPPGASPPPPLQEFLYPQEAIKSKNYIFKS